MSIQQAETMLLNSTAGPLPELGFKLPPTLRRLQPFCDDVGHINALWMRQVAAVCKCQFLRDRQIFVVQFASTNRKSKES